MSSDIEEIRRLHRFSGARLSEPVEFGLGWKVVPRQWGSLAWDALILSDYCIGWRLAGSMSLTRGRAIGRALRELRAHVPRCTRCQCVRSVITER